MLRNTPTSLASLVLLIVIGTLGVPQTSHALVATHGKWHPIYRVQIKHKSHDSWQSINQFESRSAAQQFLGSQRATWFAVRIYEDRIFRSVPVTNVHVNQHQHQSPWFRTSSFFQQQHHPLQFNSHSSSQGQQHATFKKK